jgi:hypothetical protein
MAPSQQRHVFHAQGVGLPAVVRVRLAVLEIGQRSEVQHDGRLHVGEDPLALAQVPDVEP